MRGFELPAGANGVLPQQWLDKATSTGVITSPLYTLSEDQFQPASLDLRLGDVAYRLRCSFLPDDKPVEAKLEDYAMGELKLDDEGVILERNRPYLIPLAEELDLPAFLRAKANPKSSTGRLDIFTRVICDNSYRFDDIPAGYTGKLYLEVVSRSFTIRVRRRLSLNQLRLAVGQTRVADERLAEIHAVEPLLYKDGKAFDDPALRRGEGLFLSLDLQGDPDRVVGYRAKRNSKLLDLASFGELEVDDFWDPVFRDRSDPRVVLEPEEFYLLLSSESIRIPPTHAAEMGAYDPTSGELRTHYAGFFDPGFGHDHSGLLKGSRAALEVRAHDVPFMVEHGQRVCKFTLEDLYEPPNILYGEDLASNYQGQRVTLSKHFRVPDRTASAQMTLPLERTPSVRTGRIQDTPQSV